MGGFFGVASKEDCVFDLFFGIDYHSHLGTRRGGMAVLGEKGFDRAMIKTFRRWKEIWESDAFLIMNPSH